MRDAGYTVSVICRKGFYWGVEDWKPARGVVAAEFISESLAEEGKQTVNCVTIQDFCREQGIAKIDLLKKNCEGAEYEIFEGCSPEDFPRMPRIRLEYRHLDEAKRNGPWLAKYWKTRAISSNITRVIAANPVLSGQRGSDLTGA